MHEFSVAAAMVRAVLDSLKGHDFEKILSVEVKVGELTHINPDQLSFGFEAASKGTPLEGAELKINQIPGELACRRCSRTLSFSPGEIPGIPTTCPSCGGDLEIRAGEELGVESVKIETED